jgi:hypothetical protein
MGSEIHHGNYSLDTSANLHVAEAIRNTGWYEVPLRASAHKRGRLAHDTAPKAEGVVQAPEEPRSGHEIDAEADCDARAGLRPDRLGRSVPRGPARFLRGTWLFREWPAWFRG